MVKISIALAAVFAIAAHASMQGGQPEGGNEGKGHDSPQEDHPEYHPQQNYHPQNHPMPLPNNTFTKPTISPSSVLPSGSVGTSPSPSGTSPSSSASTPDSPITNSPPVGTGSSAVPSSGASSGFSVPANSSAPVGSTVSEYTTEIVYETVTTCPVTKTHGSGESASVEVTQTVSTVTSTSTSTICTQCVAPPKTEGPSTVKASDQPTNGPIKPSDKPSNGPIAPYPTGAPSVPIGTGIAPGGTGASGPRTITTEITSGGQEITLTYTLGAGSSTAVVTTTIKNTKTATNTHTVYATPQPGQGSSPEQTTPEDSPENSPEDTSGSSPEEGAEETSTVKHYVTSTQYVTANKGQSTCPAQVTVTVPGLDVTVTVTAMGQPPSDVPGGPGSSSQPPFPTGSFSNSTLPGTSSSGFITMPSPSASFNPTPYSELFPSPSAHARR